MNQILFTNNSNNYNKVDTKKIIKIFSIAILLVALIIIGIKVYGMYQDKKISQNGIMPEISIIRENIETREVTIKATCEEGIQYIVYTWNDEQENRVNLNGTTAFERIIDIPQNTMNNLKVEVVSVKGTKNQKTEIFEFNIDNTKPTIDAITIKESKLYIEASDDKGIKYLAYQWENEEEVKIELPENENQKITAEIDIQRGTYKLQIRVVDINGNEEILSRLVTGVNEPEIDVIKYGDTVHISVSHDMGFKKIEFIVNNKVYVYDENYSKYNKDKNTVEFDFPLQEGENLVQINAYSLEKLSEEENEELENYSFKRFTGRCTYEP